MLRRFIVLSVIVTIAACRPATETPASKPAPPDARVGAVADAFLNAWFDRNPDQATYYGVPGRHHDRLPDNSREALESWQAREDNFLAAERLADQMRLYSSDLDRIGMLSGQALRAARLVVDSGLHTMAWTRRQAIDYMLAHTAENEHDVTSEVDRYIIYPAQATSYMLGELEIRAARDEAQTAMGQRFDIKAFHDRVLEDGAVPLTFLRAKISEWGKR